jgi:hypothetical protein
MRGVIALAACVLLAGCGGEPRGEPQHLPKPAHWFGSKIWVPTGYAQGVAAAVCHNGERSGWWQATPFAGGELLECEEVQQQFAP